MKLQPNRIEEVCDVTSSKRIFKADYQTEGVPFYRAKEISQKHKGAKQVSDQLFISREKFEKIKNKFGAPVDGDLLLTSIGALLGEPYVVKNDGDFYFKDGNLTWFRNFRNATSKFLYYWLLSPDGKGQLQTAIIGSAQPAFTIAALKRMEVRLPNLSDQKCITFILSTYDKLIENNTRRIAVLEDMARRLYEEWFVHFRYPGHEDASFTETEHGQVPEGWEYATLGSLVEVKKGKNITKKTIIPGDVPVVAGGLNPAYYHNASNTTEPIVTVSASGANAGFVRLYQQDVWASDCSYIDATATSHVLFFYLLLKYYQSDVTRMQRGSAQPHVYPSDLMELPVVEPPTEVIEQLQTIVEPQFALIKILEKKNANLRAQRDILLPKLISGEIGVSETTVPDEGEAAA
jgi:type I restriction enzyme, S subunit